MTGVHTTPDTWHLTLYSGVRWVWKLGAKAKKVGSFAPNKSERQVVHQHSSLMRIMICMISVDSFRRTNAFSKKITSASVIGPCTSQIIGFLSLEKSISGVIYRVIGFHPTRTRYPTKIGSGVGWAPDTWMCEKSGRVAPDTHPPDHNFTQVQGPM
jgi:hypothetical protein